jgi:ketosteroid isomerase-like protein
VTRAIEVPGSVGDPDLQVVRMVEEGDTAMAELVGRVPQQDGSAQRLSMAEVFVLRDGLIRERRAWVIPLPDDRRGGTPGDDVRRVSSEATEVASSAL